MIGVTFTTWELIRMAPLLIAGLFGLWLAFAVALWLLKAVWWVISATWQMI